MRSRSGNGVENRFVRKRTGFVFGLGKETVHGTVIKENLSGIGSSPFGGAGGKKKSLNNLCKRKEKGSVG